VLIKIIEKALLVVSQASMYILGAMAVGLLLMIFYEEGVSGVWSTITIDMAKMAPKFLIIFAVIIVITGSVNHLARKHPETVRDIIRGNYGIVTMLVLATTMPGAAGGQQVQDAWNTPNINRTNVLLCLVATMGAAMMMFMFKAMFIGPTLTLIYASLISGLMIQVWVIGRAWERFFS
jgi:hypothetical protein